MPSGRSGVRIGMITADVMGSLYNAQKYRLPDLFIDTLQNFTNVDIRTMYMEDFRMLVAWFDRNSWPQSHRTYEWRCKKKFYSAMNGERFYERPRGRKYIEVECNMLNTEDVMKHRVISHPWRDPRPGCRHPTVQRWAEYETLAETFDPTLAQAALYMDSDLSLEDTIKYSSPRDLMYAGIDPYISCEIETKHKCNKCFREYVYTNPIDILGYLRVFTETSMMNMTLDLASVNKLYVPDDITINKLLYWHSSYIQDKQKAEEALAIARAAKGRGKR